MFPFHWISWKRKTSCIPEQWKGMSMWISSTEVTPILFTEMKLNPENLCPSLMWHKIRTKDQYGNWHLRKYCVLTCQFLWIKRTIWNVGGAYLINLLFGSPNTTLPALVVFTIQVLNIPQLQFHLKKILPHVHTTVRSYAHPNKLPVAQRHFIVS